MIRAFSFDERYILERSPLASLCCVGSGKARLSSHLSQSWLDEGLRRHVFCWCGRGAKKKLVLLEVGLESVSRIVRCWAHNLLVRTVQPNGQTIRYCTEGFVHAVDHVLLVVPVVRGVPSYGG